MLDVTFFSRLRLSMMQDTEIKISGTEHAVGRAVSQIELHFEPFAEARDLQPGCWKSVFWCELNGELLLGFGRL